jgi:hypothetical protein
MRIGLIVEGHGDVTSLPLLLRSISFHKGIYGFSFPHPMRFGEFNAMMKREKFSNFVQYLNDDDNIDAIIVACDADDVCPVHARQALLERISATVHGIKKPVAVLLFNREYEALLLSQIDIIAERTGLLEMSEENVNKILDLSDKVRDAKGLLDSLIPDFSYKEARDQEKFTAILDMNILEERHRAGRRAANILERLNGGQGDELPIKAEEI